VHVNQVAAESPRPGATGVLAHAQE